MHWVRSQIHFGRWAALFALALQMAVSFGHVHLDDLGLRLAQSEPCASAVTTQASPRPADHEHGPVPHDDYCPICASIALVATAIAALPPKLILPAAVRYVWPSHRAVLASRPKLTLPFQARAPPSA
jgi:Protein of unknown function (DUF2946)